VTAPAWPTATTRGLAVLGWPVGHSLSPVMHNAALRAEGQDLVYLALPVPPEQLAEVVAALGTVGFVGANVTVPHKQAVVACCVQLTEEARLVGAVNTLTWTDDGPVGHNTDAVGLERALRDVGHADGTPTVVLGTGGAARAAVVALARLGSPMVVVGRRPDAAAEVAAVAAQAGGDGRALALDDLDVADVVAGAGTVINATSLGLQREPLPAPFMSLQPGQLAQDLVYNPPDTPFLQAAVAAGARAEHGLRMLVHQAAAAYEGWTGTSAPVDVMASAAKSALRSFEP
jgi:shikimate dehydrogenase